MKFIPFVLQAILIAIDELFFHRKRGLPRFERIGHPLDTLSVIGCFAFTLFFSYSPSLFYGYLAMALFSCALITKDEFVHQKHCGGMEHWLHALLFVNHSLMLTALYFLWKEGMQEPLVEGFIVVQTILASLFFVYQLIYWNWVYEASE